MNISKSIMTIATVFVAQLVRAQMPPDVVPAAKESKQELINVINLVSREVVTAARVAVVHDMGSRNIRIFTAKPEGTRSPFKVNGYEVEVIYNVRIGSSRAGVGSYRFQHNDAVLTFAAAKFASGEKELGLSLLKLLADAEPKLFWDSPSPVMPIDQIVKGLSKDDGSLKDFLKEMSDEWQQMAKDYGT